MNQDQINSLVRSALKIVAAMLVTHGLTQAAAIINTEDVAGLVVGVIGLLASHYTHATPPAVAAPVPPGGSPAGTGGSPVLSQQHAGGTPAPLK